MAMYEPFNNNETTIDKLKKTAMGLKDKFNQGTAQAQQSVSNFKAMPMREKLASTLKGSGKGFGTLAMPAIQAVQTYNDINTPGMDTSDQIARGAEGVSRVAGGVAGAGLGSFAGPIGSVAGGAAGYLLPDAVRNVANALGADIQLPSDKAESLRGTLTGSALANPPSVNTVAPQANVDDMSGVSSNSLNPNVANVPSSLKSPSVAFEPVQQQKPYDAIKAIQGNIPEVQAGDIPQAKAGFNPIDVNANAQEMVKSALSELKKTLANPADAQTLGDAFAQKLANKQATDKAMATAKAADQLNALASGSINMREGEQNLIQGGAQLQQQRQNLTKGGLDIEDGKQGLNVKEQLRRTLDEYSKLNDSNDKDGSKRKRLQSLALTLQGKEPKAPFDFIQVGGGTDANGMPIPKSIAVANNQTGEVKMVGDSSEAPKKPMVTTADGKQREPIDGEVANINGEQMIYDAAQGGWRPD